MAHKKIIVGAIYCRIAIVVMRNFFALFAYNIRGIAVTAPQPSNNHPSCELSVKKWFFSFRDSHEMNVSAGTNNINISKKKPWFGPTGNFFYREYRGPNL